MGELHPQVGFVPSDSLPPPALCGPLRAPHLSLWPGAVLPEPPPPRELVHEDAEVGRRPRASTGARGTARRTSGCSPLGLLSRRLQRGVWAPAGRPVQETPVRSRGPGLAPRAALTSLCAVAQVGGVCPQAEQEQLSRSLWAHPRGDSGLDLYELIARVRSCPRQTLSPRERQGPETRPPKEARKPQLEAECLGGGVRTGVGGRAVRGWHRGLTGSLVPRFALPAPRRTPCADQGNRPAGEGPGVGAGVQPGGAAGVCRALPPPPTPPPPCCWLTAGLYSGELNRQVIAALLSVPRALGDIWNNDPGAGRLPPSVCAVAVRLCLGGTEG